jgi:hypothetical protein
MDSQRLNGSKVLKGVSAFALSCPPERDGAPLQLCRAVAGAGINMPYVTIAFRGRERLVTLAVERTHEGAVRAMLGKAAFGAVTWSCHSCAVLSLFPHQSNPGIPAALFASFRRAGMSVLGLANSPSALSILVREEQLDTVARVLFDAFTFRGCATPDEWKAAQEGKETLYKEVVASYQEKRPKVYGVTCIRNQQYVAAPLDDESLSAAIPVMEEAAKRRLRLSLIASLPLRPDGLRLLTYCLPGATPGESFDLLPTPLPESTLAPAEPFSVFTMNGPHFGDRYGIAGELLAAIDQSGISLTALNCTVASITGAVPQRDLAVALEAIQACFEVPPGDVLA